MDANEIRRLFASVPSERQVLTVNGLIYDHVHYRHNQDGVAEIINNNYCFQPFSKRLEEDGRIEVQIRCWEFDIDMIEVLDETTGRYHPMWSTDPDYTGGLSRWEHRHYYNLLKQSNRGSARQKERVKVKARSDELRRYDDEIYTLGIRQRGKLFALIDAEQNRTDKLATGQQRAQQTDEGEGDHENISWPVRTGGEGRNDLPKAPKQKSRRAGKRQEHIPPKRPADYGMSSTADLTRPVGPSEEHPFLDPSASKSKFQRRRSRNG